MVKSIKMERRDFVTKDKFSHLKQVKNRSSQAQCDFVDGLKQNSNCKEKEKNHKI